MCKPKLLRNSASLQQHVMLIEVNYNSNMLQDKLL